MRNFVDQPSRKIASQLLRDFISGKISNDDFEEGQPETHDRAIGAVWSTAWMFCDDFKEHRLEGAYRLSSDQRRICIRWLMFLHSELPYEWPDIYLPGSDPASRVKNSLWRRLVARVCDKVTEVDAQRFLGAGHYRVWPYVRVSDHKQSLRAPRLLGGRPARTDAASKSLSPEFGAARI